MTDFLGSIALIKFSTVLLVITYHLPNCSVICSHSADTEAKNHFPFFFESQDLMLGVSD